AEHWVAFVPYAARWPFEIHIYPLRRMADLTELSDDEQDDFASLYLDVLNRLERVFSGPSPYMAGWHQAPVHRGRGDSYLHLQLACPRRAVDRLKYLASSESLMGAFINDVAPEEAAAMLRD